MLFYSTCSIRCVGINTSGGFSHGRKYYSVGPAPAIQCPAISLIVSLENIILPYILRSNKISHYESQHRKSAHHQPAFSGRVTLQTFKITKITNQLVFCNVLKWFAL